MINSDLLLGFAEDLILRKKNVYLSDLQRTILFTSLNESRKTYDQIAEELGYSSKYIKQDVAPKLWQLLSETLNKKATKSNVYSILEHEFRNDSPVIESVSPSKEIIVTPTVNNSDSVSIDNDKINILLVDDQPKNLRLLSDLLEEQGYEVQQAINGNIALQAIALSSPDIILLDIQMPELDGYQVCQKLKVNPETQDIPVIFVSSLDEGWDKVKAFSVGGCDYISKPFKIVEVLARVENQLKVVHLQRELKQLKEKNLELQQIIDTFPKK